MNPRGSDAADARTSGASSDTYSWVRAKRCLSSVVFPDCLGPVSTTAGNSLAARLRAGSRARGIYCSLGIPLTMIDIMHYNCIYARSAGSFEFGACPIPSAGSGRIDDGVHAVVGQLAVAAHHAAPARPRPGEGDGELPAAGSEGDVGA